MRQGKPAVCLRVFFVIFVSFQLLACKSSLPITSASFSNSDGSSSPELRLEIAETNSTRQLGLMYRKEMSETGGMLFIFPDETERAFWMKNTYLGLDIIYLNSDKQVVSISKNAVPHSLKRRESKLPAKYVVELLAGSSEKWKITPGSQLKTAP